MARTDYTLVVFDEHGQELKDEHGDLGSAKVIAKLQSERSTDVFIMSHGWMGDIPAALFQYNGWTDAMLKCTDDLARMSKLRPGFKPLMIGYHWPSRPFGDEQTVASFGIDGAAAAFDPVADWAKRLGNTPAIQAAVQRVFNEVAAAPDPAAMHDGLAQAYVDLDKLLSPDAEGVGSAPGADRLPFDPKQMYQAIQDASGDDDVNFGSFTDGLLSLLREMSFWTMKGRARSLGESVGADLLIRLQDSAAGRDVRFHMMGHSFGAIVVSAMIGGSRSGGRTPASVQSAVLVQGAMSLWSYAPKIPKTLGAVGYFHPNLLSKKVTGPIVTTQSQFDKAVGTLYPLAAGVVLEASFADVDLPLFGGLGTFGMQGVDHQSLPQMIAPSEEYGFEAGKVYNIQSDNIIKTLDGGPSGAHSDIYHPEVGHVIWQAAMV